MKLKDDKKASGSWPINLYAINSYPSLLFSVFEARARIAHQQANPEGVVVKGRFHKLPP